MCEDAGGRQAIADFAWSPEKYEENSKSGRYFIECSEKEKYVGHLSYDRICCKGRPNFL